MVRENLAQVRKHMEEACRRAGRQTDEVTLIAVSKTKPVGMLMEAYEAGAGDFGENKVQEILEKRPEIPADARFHMIGHLQRNKVRQVIDQVTLIHSVDSLRLAEQIEHEAAKKELHADILLEVNVAREESKFGFFLEEVEDALRENSKYSHIPVKGLINIAPYVEDPEENRDIFKKLHQVFIDMKSKNIDNSNMSVLSMGMTGDYQVAIEEGSTMIRVGTGIFGAR